MPSFFEVIRNKYVFVELQFLQWINIYKVFHLNLFQKAFTETLTNQDNKLLTPVIINNKEEWKVEDIFDAKSY